MTSSYHTFLGGNPLVFSEGSVDEEVSFFYDEVNRHVFVVREDSRIRLIPCDRTTELNLAVGNRGVIQSLRLSLDYRYLAIQRSTAQIEFVDVSTKQSFYQNSKNQRSKILGFRWTFDDEFVIISNSGVEVYQFNPDKGSKLVKSFNETVNWYLYSHESRVLVVATGSANNVIIPYHLKHGLVNRLPKFEIPLSPFSADPILNKQQKLHAKDVVISIIYGRLYMLHINSVLSPSEVSLYQITKDDVTKKFYLNLQESRGDFTVNVIDNLIIVHSFNSTLSMIFDIKAQNSQYPVVSPLPMGYEKEKETNPPLYSKDWVTFHPDVVMCLSSRHLWNVTINLENIASAFTEKQPLLEFLLRRKNSQSLTLQFLKSTIEKKTSLSIISRLFDHINSICSSVVVERAYGKAIATVRMKEKKSSSPSIISYLGLQTEEPKSPTQFKSGKSNSTTPINSPMGKSSSSLALNSPGSPKIAKRVSSIDAYDTAEGRQSLFLEDTTEALPKAETISPKGMIVIDQELMYTWVFSHLEENKTLNFKYILSILIEYIRSLNAFHIPVNHYIYEMAINMLVTNQRCYQLHQFLQYHVVKDSTHVACLLLSLENQYPPSYQLAIDMLKRLGTIDDIVEVLLLKKQVLAAIRFVRSNDLLEKISAKRFLETAKSTNDKMVFYNTFKFFEERNATLYNTSEFKDSEDCFEYVQFFKQTFPGDSKFQAKVK